MKQTLLDPYFWLNVLFLVFCAKFLWRATVDRLHQLGYYPVQEWAERLLRYSWANQYPELEQLIDCFSCGIYNQAGQEIYLVHADWYGTPLDMGLRHYQPEITLGYYTDNCNYAKVFQYHRDLDRQLHITVYGIGRVCLIPPSLPQPLRDRSWVWPGP